MQTLSMFIFLALAGIAMTMLILLFASGNRITVIVDYSSTNLFNPAPTHTPSFSENRPLDENGGIQDCPPTLSPAFGHLMDIYLAEAPKDQPILCRSGELDGWEVSHRSSESSIWDRVLHHLALSIPQPPDCLPMITVHAMGRRRGNPFYASVPIKLGTENGEIRGAGISQHEQDLIAESPEQLLGGVTVQPTFQWIISEFRFDPGDIKGYRAFHGLRGSPISPLEFHVCRITLGEWVNWAIFVGVSNWGQREWKFPRPDHI